IGQPFGRGTRQPAPRARARSRFVGRPESRLQPPPRPNRHFRSPNYSVASGCDRAVATDPRQGAGATSPSPQRLAAGTASSYPAPGPPGRSGEERSGPDVAPADGLVPGAPQRVGEGDPGAAAHPPLAGRGPAGEVGAAVAVEVGGDHVAPARRLV